MKKKILILSDWFEPAYKAGGPIRSTVNFVQHMKEDYSLFVFTSDRDLHADEPMPGILVDSWQEYASNVKIFYASPSKTRFNSIKEIIRSVDPDFIYLNSFFSTSFAIYPLLIKRLWKIRATVVVSPRGMLKPSALQFKAAKKKLFLFFFRLLGIHRRIRFLATDKNEQADIIKQFPHSDTWVASNFGAPLPVYEKTLVKNPGSLAIVFIGRIHPIKNLDFLLRALHSTKGIISLTIVGVLENQEYWNNCKQIIASLPSSIETKYTGDLPYHQLGKVISNHHIFALPTQGENFGHAIFEALSFGKPVVISDQTPWRALQSSKAGWDLSLTDITSFTNALQTAVNWEQKEYNEWSYAAWQKAGSVADHSILIEQYKKIFS